MIRRMHHCTRGNKFFTSALVGESLVSSNVEDLPDLRVDQCTFASLEICNYLFEVYINYSAITIKIPHLSRISTAAATVQINSNDCANRVSFRENRCANRAV